MTLTTLRPNGSVSNGSWGIGTNPTSINDASDASYLRETNGDSEFVSNFDDLPSYAEIVSSITAYMRYSRSSVSDSATANQFVRLSSNTTYQGAQSGGAISTVSFSPARPGGGSVYSPADINTMTGGVKAASGIPTEEVYVYDLWWDVEWYPGGGGFACLVGSLAGAALGLAEMAALAQALHRRTRTLITPDEYAAAWRDIRGHRWPMTLHMGGAR